MYICKCGETFDKPNNFNGHKSHCKVHLGEKRYLEIINIRKECAKKAHIIQKQNRLKQKKFKEEIWINEKHKCEYCNKIMVYKYGSGRFCNKSCANSYSSSHINNFQNSIQTYRERAFKSFPHKCAVCGYNEEIGILQVHHIDGNRKNSKLDNLVILCPNCHCKISFCNYELLQLENCYKIVKNIAR